MRVRVAATCLTMISLLAGTALLTGCAQKPLPAPAPVAPDPFGYLKRSKVCVVGPVATGPQSHSVTLSTRSDDGLCGLTIHQPDGGPYASFLLTGLPAHGKSFIYNYNGQTYVTYTADTAYAGPDSFTVSLVAADGQPRSTLNVRVVVDATGVARPAPPAPPPPASKPRPHRKARHPVHHAS